MPRRLQPAVVVAAVALAAAHAAAQPGAAPAPAPFRFVDATPGSGIEAFRNVCGAAPGEKGWLAEGMGAGAAWLDYDGDGRLDLYLVNGSTFERQPGRGEPNRMFRGVGDGRFVDVTAATKTGDRGWGYGVAVGDVDGDGHPDVFVANFGPNALLRNRGDGTFEDVSAKAGLAAGSDWSSSAAFFDMDLDGDLDLYVTNYIECDPKVVPRRGSPEAVSINCRYKGVPVFCGPLGRVAVQDRLYRNDGTGRFADVTAAAGIALEQPRYALGVVTGDYDNDGDQDVYVANDSVVNSLWRNRGDGTFEDVGLLTLSGLNGDGESQAGMGTDFGDYDGDGWLDLVVTNFSQDLNTVYRNLEGAFFTDDSTPAGLGATYWTLSWGTGFRDFDRDGDLDLFIANGHVYPQMDDVDLGTRFKQRNHLFANDGGRFVEVSKRSGPGLEPARSFRGAAFGDYDDDGDVDVLVTALDEAPLLLRNETDPAGRWLRLTLVGTASNRDAIGARVTVEAGGRRIVRERHGGGSYLSANDPRMLIGLGAAERAAAITIRWPSGRVERLTDVAADRPLTIVEGRAPASSGD